MASKKSDPNIIIAVMGPTGSGKSRVIDLLTENTKWAASGSVSVTDRVCSAKALIPTSDGPVEILLVDTPGLDDTHRSDADVLEMIAKWLKERYEKKVYLTGILYLHRITDNRMAGTPLRNLRVFGKLCGGEEEVGKRVVFVTTMWDKLRDEKTQKKGGEREGELKQYWQPMLDKGASTGRFNDTKTSAEEIVKGILRHQRGHRPVLLQEEMVDHNRHLAETEAAQTLYTQYQSLLSQHKATLLEIEKAARRSADERALLDLEKQRKDIEDELELTYVQARKIKVGVAHRITAFFKKPPKRGLELGVTAGPTT